MYLASMYLRLERILAPSGHSEALLDHCEREERDHRKHRPSSIRESFGLTVSDAARLLYVRSVLCWATGQRPPDMRDVWSLPMRMMGGYALYAAHEKEIRAAFTPAEIHDFVEGGHADYAALVSGDYGVQP